eukprot:10609118-Alexandrium_andersonii.AAC.1
MSNVAKAPRKATASQGPNREDAPRRTERRDSASKRPRPGLKRGGGMSPEDIYFRTKNGGQRSAE